MKFPIAMIVVFLGCAAGQASASGVKGTIKGSLDGREIDVKATCFPDKKPWDWIQVNSEALSRSEALRDVDGDGIAILAGASQGMGQATITAKIGETSYKFGVGKRGVTFYPTGFKLVGKFDRTEGKGADRKVVHTFQAELTVSCTGI